MIIGLLVVAPPLLFLLSIWADWDLPLDLRFAPLVWSLIPGIIGIWMLKLHPIIKLGLLPVYGVAMAFVLIYFGLYFACTFMGDCI